MKFFFLKINTTMRSIFEIYGKLVVWHMAYSPVSKICQLFQNLGIFYENCQFFTAYFEIFTHFKLPTVTAGSESLMEVM